MKRLATLFVATLPFLLFAEGTKQLRPNETDFGYINLMDQQNNLGSERTFALYNSPEETRLNIRIQDPTNEVISLGLKTTSTNPLFYRIIAPNGSIFLTEQAVPMDDDDDGFIETYQEAIAGPTTVNPLGYEPIEITPTQAGDYSIEFRDPAHNPPGAYAKRRLELFDITVVDQSNNTTIEGRLWSKAWDITTNSSTNTFNGSAYIYTNDGIVAFPNQQAFLLKLRIKTSSK